MKRKDLANEIRGAGFGLRYADGPATMTSRVGNRLVSHHSPKSKLRMPDAMIIGLAASCSTCEVVASVEDIELATEWADCYQSFARLIWPCIPHKKRCPAKPYIPVSKSAVRYFQKAKAEFDAKRKARAEARAKMTPEESEAHRKARLAAEAEQPQIEYSKALNAVQNWVRREQVEAVRKAKLAKSKKKLTKKKTVQKKAAKKKPVAKKPTKRKRR